MRFRCLEGVPEVGLMQSSVAKIKRRLNIFLKSNISNEKVTSYQTSLFVPHAKHALVHRCPFRLPVAPYTRCCVNCSAGNP